ncbi:DNA mismatch repair protein MutS [Desulfonatronum sp. SC1]|uniref:DNA mismatch repair protein MutS n=1 Tax=Desulfonatronum sp. SC1 TaxID=2109626 RepID=UPI000D322C5D|nr:DNA mismatch repair protein MutS [Desulfonatronum sp. SC1]PTN35614.1 DNA mismatch repair protein MutS [Desulfonatronum sp. SC1]
MSESSPPKLTPMLEQYLGIKAAHPDALLFFRMGDFYELFFEDAETAARELQITLTSRNPNAENPVPMCGVPYHACESYLTQLLSKGLKVAICDQVEDPKEAKGLVKRAVTRVLTPGTLVEDAGLEAKEHHFLAALFWDAQADFGGLAWVDVSTGECRGVRLRGQMASWSWVAKLQPRELLLPDHLRPPVQAGGVSTRITPLPVRGFFEFGQAKERVLRSQGVADLHVLDLENKPQLTQAFGALLAYLKQTQKHDPNHLQPLQVIQPGDFLLLDEVTLRNLEVFRRLDGGRGPGTLRHVLDQTLTSMGGRLLESRLHYPWKEPEPILQNQAVVAALLENDVCRSELAQRLSTTTDLERIATRISMNRTSPRDFAALRQGVARLPGLRETLGNLLQAHDEQELDMSKNGSPASPTPDANSPHILLQELLRSWDDLNDLTDLLQRALVDSPPLLITDGGIFRSGYDQDLDALLDLVEHGQDTLREMLAREQELTGQPKLKMGYNRVFGYYFELPRSQTRELPERFQRRQSLVSSERFVTEELKELEDRLLGASDRRKILEHKLFQELRDKVDQFRSRVMRMAETVARLDVWLALAEAARKWSWSRPNVTTDLNISIIGGRHPGIEACQGSADYIPNDVHLDDQRRVLIITGPNMGGKSTVLRQTALICILAQIGSFVPATQASIGLTDRIFTRVGASDNLSLGQSTFMVEMIETARILRQATQRSLVILDEIGRGTSTYDGLALAWAVVEELSGHGVKQSRGPVRTLFATHYHELTSLEGRLPGVRNYNIAVKEWKGDIIFLRRLVPGPSDRSYGIEVAKLAGLPRGVVARAKEILEELDAAKKPRMLHQSSNSARRQLLREPLPGLGITTPSRENPEEADILNLLRDLDPKHLSPMQALTLLQQWKERLEGGE